MKKDNLRKEATQSQYLRFEDNVEQSPSLDVPDDGKALYFLKFMFERKQVVLCAKTLCSITRGSQGNLELIFLRAFAQLPLK